MLDRRLIRENPEIVREAARLKGIDFDVDELLRLDDLARSLQTRVDEGQRLRRELADQFRGADEAGKAALRTRSSELDTELAASRPELELAQVQLRDLMLRV